MKILFAIAVLIACGYLFLPQEQLKKLTLLLPEQQIEQAAETVLSNVDQKLEKFKVELLASKDSRISDLEKQLANVEIQLLAQQEKHQLANSQNSKQAQQPLPQEQPLAAERPLAATQYISEETPTDHASIDSDVSTKKADKQRAIKRQAYLQDLAERMNKTSLLALTK